MAYLRAYQAMAGDPGFFKKIGKGFKKFGKNIGRFAPGMMGLLPIPGAGLMSQFGSGFGGGGCPPMGDPGIFGTIGAGLRRVFNPGVGRAIVGAGSRILPVIGGATPIGAIARTVLGGVAAGAASGAIGRMFRGGGGGEGRSYRRMNVGNTKALRRAMRRVEGFSKLAKSTMSFTSTHRLKKRGRRK